MILLDTHIFVPLALGQPASYAEELGADDLAVSAISAAEVACLVRAGRLTLQMPPAEWFEQAISVSATNVLPLTPVLLARAFMLEWSHRDPADRILVQTLIETPNLTLFTKDATILAYADERGLRCRDCR
jgi:PIN domain nuclease of toxin-antitoxin system